MSTYTRCKPLGLTNIHEKYDAIYIHDRHNAISGFVAFTANHIHIIYTSMYCAAKEGETRDDGQRDERRIYSLPRSFKNLKSSPK